MNEIEVLDIARDAVFTLLKIVTPILSVALFVGLIIGIFQALTQIQEMTLAFVPKIISVFVALILLFPFMLNQMRTGLRILSRKERRHRAEGHVRAKAEESDMAASQRLQEPLENGRGKQTCLP